MHVRGNTATDISRYNSCKADLNNPSMHTGTASQSSANELDQLRAENALNKADRCAVSWSILPIFRQTAETRQPYPTQTRNDLLKPAYILLLSIRIYP